MWNPDYTKTVVHPDCIGGHGHACPPTSADTDITNFEDADMDADTDITKFWIADMNIENFQIADTEADTEADTGMTFSKNRGHGHDADKPRTRDSPPISAGLGNPADTYWYQAETNIQ